MPRKAQVICITGDRDWDDRKLIHKVLEKWPPGTWLINGMARGADTIADDEALTLGFHRIKIPYYNYAGKAGGPLRNQVMADITEALRAAGHPYIVIAFHADLQNSRGTKDMVRRCEKLGLTVRKVKGWKT